MKIKKPFKLVSQLLAERRAAGNLTAGQVIEDQLNAKGQSQATAGTIAALDTALADLGKLNVADLENLAPADQTALRLLAAKPPGRPVSEQIHGRPADAPKTTSLEALEAKFAAETDPKERGRLASQMRALRNPACPVNIRQADQLRLAAARALQIRRARQAPNALGA